VATEFTAVATEFTTVATEFTAVATEFTTVATEFTTVATEFTAVATEFTAVATEFTAVAIEFTTVKSKSTPGSEPAIRNRRRHRGFTITSKMRRFLIPFLLCLLTLPVLADDLTISWISRLPELDYVWGSTKPKTDGWPLVGSQVTWRAHVRSWLPSPKSVTYIWRVDDVEVKRGSTTLAPNAVTNIDLARFWSFDRRRIELELDGKSLEVFSDAISVGFWVEQSFYDEFRANQDKLGIGSTGFEDWAQRTIELFNSMAALAIYPETPNGVIDRFRLQKIVIVPDDSLPLSGLPAEASLGASGSSHPDHEDRSVDLMWGFRKALLPSYVGGYKPDPVNPYYAGTAVLHELGHARSLVDVYAWDVLHDPPEFVIDVTEAGQRITGSQTGRVHRTGEQGFMNKHYTHIDRYSAMTMNFLAGRRAVMGNYNEPRNFAAYLNDFPAQNRVTIRDANGGAIANADVFLYQAQKTIPTERWYGARFDDTPDLTLKTDANGQVLVGRSPFSPNGKVTHAADQNDGVVIVKVKKGNFVAHGFLESRLFNLEYWRGNTQLADHELIVGRECTADGPRILAAWNAQTTGASTLEWLGMADATGYHVYVSSNLGKPWMITTRETSVTLHLNGRIDWWVEADLGLCGTRRSGAGRLQGTATPVPRRRSARH
jgi:hypothetical protein